MVSASPDDEAAIRAAVERAAEAMRAEALHDPLTGLPNRALLLDRLAQATARARRAGTLAAVLFIDLDRFKLVNDSFGHATGDELLVAVGRRLRTELRASDTVARLGGDEFALVAEDVGAPVDALEIAERLIGALDEPFTVAGRELYVGASIGIAMSEGEDDPEELLRCADTAMYRAKQETTSAYEVFEPHMRSALVERMELEADLRRAIENEDLHLVYQPIVSLGDGELIGFEALARWIHPERGFVSPGDFIPLAEETGLILPLGRWVLDAACRQLAEWGAPDVLMSVNISGVQLRRPGFTDEALRTVAAHGLATGDVMLEVTETILMQNTDSAVTRLHELRALGFRLGIDDFGTGYSSLRYVRNFPVHVLKVAKPFVDEVAEGGDGAAVAGAVVQLGQNLGLQLIAEGIEHPEQADALDAMGCELGQGFHFSRPLDAEAAGALIAPRPAARAA